MSGKGARQELERIGKTRNVPAKLGGKVIYTGTGAPQSGTITGAKHGYVMIRLDGEKLAKPYHPTWELEYEK